MEVIQEYINKLQDSIDATCEGKRSWEIVLRTTAAVLLLVITKAFLWQDEGIWTRIKKTVMRYARKIPFVKNKIESEKQKVEDSVKESFVKRINNTPYLTNLPPKGWKKEKILAETEKYTKFGEYRWENGYASGTVYNGNKDLTHLTNTVSGMTAWSNPLHADVFPGVAKMEAEVVRMVCNMFHGGPKSCGVISSGGTESIVLACKAYRDYAINIKGIKKPEMLVPVTAHAAFDKGAQLLGIPIKHVPIDPVTMKVDLKAMEKMITSRTCMLAGSSPHFPHGIVDPIKEIAALGVKYDIPVHVDACLGGFLVAFMEKAGFPLPPFDFRVTGVTSISADTHKYGYAPKGTSTILYSSHKYRHHQFFVTPDWPGGIYATPTIAGSRSGSVVATCWASMVYHGVDGYVEHTRNVIKTARKLAAECNKIPGIFVYGKPEISVVALGSKKFNIYTLGDYMNKRGWNLNALQKPSSIHIAVTVQHTQKGVAERFIKDLQEVSASLIKNPPKDAGKSAAMYGSAATIPDRTIVNEMAWAYIDAIFSTDEPEPHKK